MSLSELFDQAAFGISLTVYCIAYTMARHINGGKTHSCLYLTIEMDATQQAHSRRVCEAHYGHFFIILQDGKDRKCTQRNSHLQTELTPTAYF